MLSCATARAPDDATTTRMETLTTRLINSALASSSRNDGDLEHVPRRRVVADRRRLVPQIDGTVGLDAVRVLDDARHVELSDGRAVHRARAVAPRREDEPIVRPAVVS